jgi:translation elongation factor EF-1alpha
MITGSSQVSHITLRAFSAYAYVTSLQADLAALVISARKGEFETGFEKGGQTRE